MQQNLKIKIFPSQKITITVVLDVPYLPLGATNFKEKILPLYKVITAMFEAPYLLLTLHLTLKIVL